MFTPHALPEPVVPLLDGVRALSGAQQLQHTSAEERAQWLAGLRALIDSAEAVFAETLAVFDAHGDGETLHAARSTASWLRGALRLAPGDAAERVRIARGSRDVLSEPVAQLAGGGVTFDQVRAIERSIRPLPEPTQHEAVHLLTELAQHADVSAVRVAGQRIKHVVDPDGALSHAQSQFDRRYLHLSPMLDGMTALDGLLDAESTTLLTTALAPFLVPAGPHDDRTTAQRRADGLVDITKAAMDAAQLPELAAMPTQLQVLIPLPTLVGTGGPGQLPEHPSGSHWLTTAAAGRLACDAEVSRILLGPDALPLELGRGHRLFSTHQRRALALRDGGCRFPTCDRPSRYTDAHHIQPWHSGGTTDLANAVLLCRHHHRQVHENGWTITVTDPTAGPRARVWFTAPSGAPHPSDPRGP